MAGRPIARLAAKRALDVLVAGLVLLLLAPLLLAIALAVRLTSRGPVVARQERIGLDGRPFSLRTFRIMAQDQRPSHGRVPKLRRDRVTRVGRVAEAATTLRALVAEGRDPVRYHGVPGATSMTGEVRQP